MEDEPGRLQSTVSPRVIHDLVTNTLHIEVYTYVYAFKCYVDVKDKYKNTCKVIFSVCVYFIYIYIYISQYQSSSVAQSCPTFCNPMDCSTPGLPVHHQLLEFTQTHVR